MKIFKYLLLIIYLLVYAFLFQAILQEQKPKIIDFDLEKSDKQGYFICKLNLSKNNFSKNKMHIMVENSIIPKTQFYENDKIISFLLKNSYLNNFLYIKTIYGNTNRIFLRYKNQKPKIIKKKVKINNLSKTILKPNQIIDISGDNFSYSKINNKVFFNDIANFKRPLDEKNYLEWGTNNIKIIVPPWMGNGSLEVKNNFGKSSINYEVSDFIKNQNLQGYKNYKIKYKVSFTFSSSNLLKLKNIFFYVPSLVNSKYQNVLDQKFYTKPFSKIDNIDIYKFAKIEKKVEIEKDYVVRRYKIKNGKSSKFELEKGKFFAPNLDSFLKKETSFLFNNIKKDDDKYIYTKNIFDYVAKTFKINKSQYESYSKNSKTVKNSYIKYLILANYLKNIGINSKIISGYSLYNNKFIPSFWIKVFFENPIELDFKSDFYSIDDNRVELFENTKNFEDIFSNSKVFKYENYKNILPTNRAVEYVGKDLNIKDINVQILNLEKDK